MLKSTLYAGLTTLGLAVTTLHAVIAAPSAPKTPDPAAAVRKTLQALYDSQDAALSRHDVRQAMAAYAPSYAAVGQDGTRHTRDEEFDALEKVCAMGQNLRQSSQVEKIITRGGQASLVLHQQTAMDLFNPNTHQQIVLHTEGISQDLWAHTADGWRLTFSKTVRQFSSTGTDASPAEHQAAAKPRHSQKPVGSRPAKISVIR